MFEYEFVFNSDDEMKMAVDLLEREGLPYETEGNAIRTTYAGFELLDGYIVEAEWVEAEEQGE